MDAYCDAACDVEFSLLLPADGYIDLSAVFPEDYMRL
jgi:hypothetical protein